MALQLTLLCILWNGAGLTGLQSPGVLESVAQTRLTKHRDAETGAISPTRGPLAMCVQGRAGASFLLRTEGGLPGSSALQPVTHFWLFPV